LKGRLYKMPLHNDSELKAPKKHSPEKAGGQMVSRHSTNGSKPAATNAKLVTRPLSVLDNVAIMLDVDGTLLDIAPRPQEVFVPKNLRETLQLLRRQLDGAVAFVSGRPLEDIDRIFAPLKLPAVGGHGAEIRLSGDGHVKRHSRISLNPDLKMQFYEVAKLGPGIIVEDKDYSIAVHYRLAPQLGGKVMDAVAEIYERSGDEGFEILPGKSVVEIKPRGFNKGVGVKYLMRHAPFAGRRPIFIGDDTTDHAAFAVLPDFKGIGYSVGGIVPGASFNFDGPKDVRMWLEDLSRGVPVEAR
jgi:trehalose 6-phosphate phosphatase